ncbi:MAG: acetylglutamate kinase [Anaerostipes sp.]|nr:acetylglutamate kinase [Anaerostipes sp.]MDD4369635.1 acetylglutamate kinase [Anaerostipes sp.]
MDMSHLDQEMLKAQTLIEALPFIRRFNGSYVVVKYGGSAMLDEELKYSVIKDVALLKLIGLKPIIVHGGGKEISKWVKMSGNEPEFYNGLRITDKETMEIAEMVLFKVNQSLVAMMGQNGIKAVGLSGKDAEMIRVKKKIVDGKDIGYVGDITEVKTELMEALIEDDFVPVISPIGLGENNEGYNINADDTACAIATALNAEKLVFLTDIEGVFFDPTDKTTLIPEMDLRQAHEFIDNGVVGGGMLPKLTNCIKAIENGVARVHILDGRVEHCLLLEFFTEKGVGTAILKEPLF